MLHWKARSFTYVYYDLVFVALVIQHGQRILRILSSFACLLYQIFPLYLTNDSLFGKKGVEHEMCILIFYTIFVLNTGCFKRALQL